MKREIRDMVVVITGASAGIGRALAVALHARGAKLVLSARREDRLQELHRALGSANLVVPADVSKPQDCERLIARSIEKLGRIDTLVCNAGYGIARLMAETSNDEMLAIFRTNVFGTTDCIRFAVPYMKRQQPRDDTQWRGQVMIVSSAAGRRGLPFFGAYSATKAAQIGIAEALRVELKPDRIAVTSVHPIGTNTEFGQVARQQSGVDVTPPGLGEKRQTPEEVASKMIRAIEKPRPECWPFAPSRYLLSLGTLLPSLGDRIMSKYRKQ